MSHKRPTKVDTRKVVSNAIISVSESEASDYAKYNPHSELLVHPDDVIGLTAKMKWLHKNLGNCILMDDDLNAMNRTYVDKQFDEKQKVEDPDLAYELIQSTAYVAQQMGCMMFGFNNSARPVEYDANKPYYMTGFAIGGSLGYFENFPMDKMDDGVISCQDYFTTGIAAYYGRRILINRRYAFTSKENTFQSLGGLAEFRNTDSEKSDYYLLKQYFGKAIERKKSSNLRKLQNKYERILRIPY
jgi:hypothetical protein